MLGASSGGSHYHCGVFHPLGLAGKIPEFWEGWREEAPFLAALVAEGMERSCQGLHPKMAPAVPMIIYFMLSSLSSMRKRHPPHRVQLARRALDQLRLRGGAALHQHL